MKALCWADSKRTWSTCFQSNQSVSSTIAKTINRMQPQVLESLCLSVTWSAGVESRSMNPVRFEPGRDGFGKLKSVRISVRNQYIHRHTLILLISWPRPAPKSLEMLRAERSSLSSRDPRIENFGRVTFSLSIWRKEGLVYMWNCLIINTYLCFMSIWIKGH